MRRLLYRCAKCGAVCLQLVWEALGLAAAEERCPECRRWTQFEAVNERGERVLLFGEKGRAA